MTPERAQSLADEGQELAERGQSNAYVAYIQAKKEFEADLYARLHAAPRSEQNDLRWTLSEEWANWVRAHRVDEPAAPVGPFRPLVLVGRDDYRPGPMSDG